MKNLLLILVILISAFGCGGDIKYVRFESPQPENVNSKKTFQKKIRSTYTNCYNPNEQLIITGKHVVTKQIWKLKAHRNDLDIDSSNVVVDIHNDTQIIEALEKEGLSVLIKDDTIYSSILLIDTLFYISEKNVLRKLKGSYFLNTKIEGSFWKVRRMELKKDSLFIGTITPSDTLLQFDFISKSEEIQEEDSVRIIEYLIKPSKRQFKKLLKPNSFEKTKCYYKSN
jgi:hypothetical protein